MNAIPNFSAGNGSRESGRSRLARLERMLAGECGDRREVSDTLHALSDSELMQFGLRAYHMNLLSLFGETWSHDKIAGTARAATIAKIVGGWEYHHHYLPGLTPSADALQFRELPLDLIRDILARGRGLAIATFHLGPMRYLASDMAHAGIPVCLPLANDAFGNYHSAQAANPHAAVWKGLRFVNVEEHNGALVLAKTLAARGCVISTIDGNTGLDGPRGDQRRTVVRILGSTARVKIGLLTMAARFGSPILVIIARTRGEQRLCLTGPVIDPGRPLRGDEGEAFAAAAAQSAYSFFAAALPEQAAEWSGGDHFHQWRVPVSLPPSDPADVERRLDRSLGAGGRLAINRRRIVPLNGGGDTIWSDALSGKCYRLPADMTGLAEQLSARGGVGFDWLDRHPGPERSRMWAFMCQLAARDAILVTEGPGQPGRPQAAKEIVRPLMHGTGDMN